MTTSASPLDIARNIFKTCQGRLPITIRHANDVAMWIHETAKDQDTLASPLNRWTCRECGLTATCVSTPNESRFFQTKAWRFEIHNEKFTCVRIDAIGRTFNE